MHLAYRTAGHGPPVLLIHGGAESAATYDRQAEAISRRGHRVIWYDRRGTGASPRDDWPGGGADQHADDAAALLRELHAVPATVAGFSSGGVIALALAARHPDVIDHVIAWEPAAVAVLPNADELRHTLHRPYEHYLDEHPGDWVGAFHVLLDTLSEGRADHSAPEVKIAEQNAEAILRDDGPFITARAFTPGELPADKVTIALSQAPDPLHDAIARNIAELIGQQPVAVNGTTTHEAYLHDPDAIAHFLTSGRVQNLDQAQNSI